jgi:hypothetical protein
MNVRLTIALAGSIFTLTANTCFGALDMTFAGPNYNPQNYSGQVLDGGALRLVSGDSSSSISGTFTRGGNDSVWFNENLVLFIDSRPGGFQNTENFSGAAEGLLSAASGIRSFDNARSTAYFNAPSGQSFGADYVLAMASANNGAVYRINADGSLQQVQSFTVSPSDPRSRSFSFNIDWSSIGITDTSSRGFRFYSSYVNDFGGRRFDSMENIAGTPGANNSMWFSDYRIFGVDPVPEMSNAALAIFGGLVVSGSLAMRARKCLAKRKLATNS